MVPHPHGKPYSESEHEQDPGLGITASEEFSHRIQKQCLDFVSAGSYIVRLDQTLYSTFAESGRDDQVVP